MDIKLLKKGIKFYSAYFQIENFCILTAIGTHRRHENIIINVKNKTL